MTDARPLWTDERKAVVRRLWVEGHSATEIGCALGVSRCAIIGIVHRNRAAWGIGYVLHGAARANMRRARKARRPETRVRKPANQSGQSAPPKSKPKPPPVQHTLGPMPTEGTVSLLDIRAGQCRFPMWGDPFDLATSLYCGRPVDSQSSWCPHHRRICVQPLRSSGIARQTPEVEDAAV